MSLRLERPTRRGSFHDGRFYRHFAKMAPDGTVAATMEVADGFPDPSDGASSLYIDITDLYPYDLSGIRVPLVAIQNGNKGLIKALLKAGDHGLIEKVQPNG